MYRTKSKAENVVFPNQARRWRRLLRNRWKKMIRRCYRQANSDYLRYGGRGISVDPQWLGPDGFERFFDFVNNQLPLPEGVTLEEDPVSESREYSL